MFRRGCSGATLTYPEPPERFDDARCRQALERVGLGRLVDKLDVSARWDKDLSDEDRQALAFARMALRRPAWVVIDAALEGLEPTCASASCGCSPTTSPRRR